MILQPNPKVITKPREKIELFFSCRNLKNMDKSSLTDAQLILYSQIKPQIQQNYYQPQVQTPGWTEIARTEIVKDNLNPDFTTSISVDFIFERPQKFRIACIDVDDQIGKKFEDMGYCDFLLGDLVSSKNNLLFLDLYKAKNVASMEQSNLNLDVTGKKYGTVVVRSEVKPKDIEKIQFQLYGQNLTNFGNFTSISPVLRIWKPKLDDELKQKVLDPNFNDWETVRLCQWFKVWESPKQTQSNVQFPFVSMESGKLCNGNLMFPIKVKIFSEKKSNFYFFFNKNIMEID